jgi:hypothetical protein
MMLRKLWGTKWRIELEEGKMTEQGDLTVRSERLVAELGDMNSREERWLNRVI